MKRYSFLSIFSMLFLINSTSLLKGDFSDYIPFVSKKLEQETIQKEYPAKANGIITVKDTIGSIEIKAWNQNKISLIATKKAAKAELLPAISMQDKTNADGIVITTNSSKDNKIAMDYTLIVPCDSHVNLFTQRGNIKVSGVNGRICVTTDKGNIEVMQANNTIIATANSNGSIVINQAKGNTKATTCKGNITINDAYNSVIAFTDNGNIDIKNACVPATSKINCETKYGFITLKIPQEVNANLKASANKGTVTSQHAITLKQRTTKLDSAAWKQLKSQIDGTLGSGEANIILTTNKGNIKILESKTKII